MHFPNFLHIDESTQVRLENLVHETAEKHSGDFLADNGSIGVIAFQKSQKRWFRAHCRSDILFKVFGNSIPHDFEPMVNNREQLFYSTIINIVRREFMIRGLEEMWKYKDKKLLF